MLIYWLMFSLFAAAAIFHSSAAGNPLAVGPGGQAPAVGRGPAVAPVVVALFLIALIGLRYKVGGDWANYLQIYRVIAIQSLERAFNTSVQEPAYTLINWTAAQLGAGMWLVNLLNAVPFVVGLILLSRQQTNFWLALLVATPFLIIVVGMGYTRQASALGFLMIGCSELIRTRSLLRFVGWVLIGSFFHRTVLVFIPIMLMATGQKRATVFLLGILTIVIAYYTVLPNALERYAPGYIKNVYTAAGATVRVLMNLLPAVILLLSQDKLYRSPEERTIWRTFAIMALVAAIALPLVSSSVIVDRLSIYLIPLQMFVFARLPYTRSAGTLAGVWTFLVILYTALVMFVWLNYAVNAHSWIPYRNYLQGPQ